MTTPMQIVVLTDTPFPFGLGATNRILSYSRGFVETGNSVTVLVLRPTATQVAGPAESPLAGDYCGVEYVNCAGVRNRPRGLVRRIRVGLRGLLTSLAEVRRLNARQKVDSMILVSNSAVYMWLFFLVSRLARATYVQEKSEYPFVLSKSSPTGRLYALIYTGYFYRLFDGIFVMTRALSDYFTPRIRKGAELIVVPMTVEVDRFVRCSEQSPIQQPYIAYCGDMSGEKDGVDILITAFASVCKNHLQLKLCLIGDASDQSELHRLEELVASLGIEEQTVFTGRIPRDEMPRLLCNAKALALARPSSLQSTGGFPTKLGEYLATGRPAVVTRVGEIAHYLTDGVNVFFAEPDDPGSFAARLEHVLANPDEASDIGEAGRMVAQAEFDYKPQSARLIDFLQRLKRGAKR